MNGSLQRDDFASQDGYDIDSESQPAPQSDTISSPAELSGGDPVLGYPSIDPVGFDIEPMSGAAGAKPSARSPTESLAGLTRADRSEPIRQRGRSSKSEFRAQHGRGGGTPPSPNKSPVRTGPPLPKRPKGRLFIGTTFVTVLVAVGYLMFHSMLRYTAYGEVTGRQLQLSAPWPGVVKSIHVREGDLVRAGDVIARIDSLEMRQKIEQIDDSLRIERASLSSESALLRWEAEKVRDARKLAQSEFYEKYSELFWQKAQLADSSLQLKRLKSLAQEGAASRERLDSLRYSVAGQERKIAQLTESVRALKQRDDHSVLELSLEERVEPTLTRIENLQIELRRTRELIEQGNIVAPMDGRITGTHRFVGEYCDVTQPVVDLFVDGSTELVLYVPQDSAGDYPPGSRLKVHVSYSEELVECEVRRHAASVRTAPDSISHHYRDRQNLLPIYLHIRDSSQLPSWLALGSQIALPRRHGLPGIESLGSPKKAPVQVRLTPQPPQHSQTGTLATTVSGVISERPPADTEQAGMTSPSFASPSPRHSHPQPVRPRNNGGAQMRLLSAPVITSSESHSL